jgi:hypothetical protein
MLQHWGNANTAQQAAGPNFGSALAQQLVTGFLSNMTNLKHNTVWGNVSDNTGGTVWPDAFGNGIGGTASDWLLPWP